MGKWFYGDIVVFSGAAKSVPGLAQVHLGSKSIEHVESGCVRVGGLYHALSTRPWWWRANGKGISVKGLA